MIFPDMIPGPDVEDTPDCHRCGELSRIYGFFDLFMPRATHQQRDASGISLSKNGWRRRRKRKNEKQEKNGRVAPACTEHIMF